MQTGRLVQTHKRPVYGRQAFPAPCRPILKPSGRSSWSSASGVEASEARLRASAGQKDMTSELLERAFALALMSRLKQHSGIDVDVRSTAWGLMEGKFGGMTVRGSNWRTPLELTAEKLMLDVGEMILDYQKLVWQQTVALKNVPQGSVSFTLTSQDLANFMVHPIMVGAANRAVQGHAFAFDRNTASVRLDPATGRGIITYQGVWAGNGQRYAITMTTPPPPASAARAAAASATSLAATSNTLEQLTVSARRIKPAGAAALRSTTGSYASLASLDEPVRNTPAAAAATAATAAAAAAAATATAAAAAGAPAVRRAATLTATAEAPSSWSPLPYGGAGGLSVASAGSIDDGDVAAAGLGPVDDPAALEESEEVVGEGLRRFFSSLTLNLQGIELRHPVLLVQLPGAAAGRPPAGRAGVAAGPAPNNAPGSGPSSPAGAVGAPVPALLTISMKVAMRSLPPLNMKF